MITDVRDAFIFIELTNCKAKSTVMTLTQNRYWSGGEKRVFSREKRDELVSWKLIKHTRATCTLVLFSKSAKNVYSALTGYSVVLNPWLSFKVKSRYHICQAQCAYMCLRSRQLICSRVNIIKTKPCSTTPTTAVSVDICPKCLIRFIQQKKLNLENLIKSFLIPSSSIFSLRVLLLCSLLTYLSVCVCFVDVYRK